MILEYIRKKEPGNFDMNQYYGHVYEYRMHALLFLISTLGLMAFPISPTFIGVDLIFSHIHEDQYFLAFFDSVSFILGGIALIRIYSRIFLGPHIKNYHETSIKSS
jgi:NADH:ubiquinone oxidoreductase subunit 4 (subunit M)